MPENKSPGSWAIWSRRCCLNDSKLYVSEGPDSSSPLLVAFAAVAALREGFGTGFGGKKRSRFPLASSISSFRAKASASASRCAAALSAASALATAFSPLAILCDAASSLVLRSSSFRLACDMVLRGVGPSAPSDMKRSFLFSFQKHIAHRRSWKSSDAVKQGELL